MYWCCIVKIQVQRHTPRSWGPSRWPQDTLINYCLKVNVFIRPEVFGTLDQFFLVSRNFIIQYVLNDFLCQLFFFFLKKKERIKKLKIRVIACRVWVASRYGIRLYKSTLTRSILLNVSNPSTITLKNFTYWVHVWFAGHIKSCPLICYVLDSGLVWVKTWV